MNLASHRGLRRVTIYGGLLLTLGLAAGSLTQCTMTDDNVTGISLADAKNKPDKCLKECGKAYDKAVREEFRLNHKNRKKCDEDPVCVALEQERHRDALAGIEDEYTECRSECHHQGGGGTR
jgi:hypothetical protein